MDSTYSHFSKDFPTWNKERGQGETFELKRLMGKEGGPNPCNIPFLIKSTVARNKNTSLNTSNCFNTILISKGLHFFYYCWF
jgi:hypothetical protein